MKKFILSILGLIACAICFSWVNLCGFSIYNTKGAKLNYEIESMGSTSTVMIEILNAGVENGSDFSNLQMTNFDKKGKEIGKTLSKVTCKNGLMQFNMETMMQDMFATLKAQNMEVKIISSSPLEYSSNMAIGQTLKDSEIILETYMQGQSMMKVKNQITNRKVVGKEKITVKAGTFDVFKITEDVNVNMSMAMMGNKENVTKMSQITYVNSELGNIKLQIFDAKGKVMTSQELLSYSK